MSSLQSGRWWCMVQLNAMVACDVALVSVAKVVEARGLCGGMVCCGGRRGVGRHVVCMGDDMERVRGCDVWRAWAMACMMCICVCAVCCEWMVVQAVNQNGYALEYASEELKNDHGIVLEVRGRVCVCVCSVSLFRSAS